MKEREIGYGGMGERLFWRRKLKLWSNYRPNSFTLLCKYGRQSIIQEDFKS